MSNELHDKQARFSRDMARLILKAYDMGYEITMGECYRTPEQAQWNADHGRGIAHSLHTLRLAVDLNLFAAGQLCNGAGDYAVLGREWRLLGEDHIWGGTFTRPDAYHFSITHEGVK